MWHQSDANVRGRRHRGVIMVLAILCLSVAVILLIGMVRHASLVSRHLRQREHLAQTRLLLNAGLDRAEARWKSDENYQGETWLVPKEELDGQHGGKVTISVVDGQTPALEVSAQFPDGTQHTVRLTKSVGLDAQRGGDGNR
jgi:type II secretory pathway component PulK